MSVHNTTKLFQPQGRNADRREPAAPTAVSSGPIKLIDPHCPIDPISSMIATAQAKARLDLR
jgi:hypothetical protein